MLLSVRPCLSLRITKDNKVTTIPPPMLPNSHLKFSMTQEKLIKIFMIWPPKKVPPGPGIGKRRISCERNRCKFGRNNTVALHQYGGNYGNYPRLIYAIYALQARWQKLVTMTRSRRVVLPCRSNWSPPWVVLKERPTYLCVAKHLRYFSGWATKTLPKLGLLEQVVLSCSYMARNCNPDQEWWQCTDVCSDFSPAYVGGSQCATSLVQGHNLDFPKRS